MAMSCNVVSSFPTRPWPRFCRGKDSAYTHQMTRKFLRQGNHKLHCVSFLRTNHLRVDCLRLWMGLPRCCALQLLQTKAVRQGMLNHIGSSLACGGENENLRNPRKEARDGPGRCSFAQWNLGQAECEMCEASAKARTKSQHQPA